MKRVLSCLVVASGLTLGLVPAAMAADAAARPDAARGEKLYVDGDLDRGVISCASCHGVAGNSTIPMNPNLASQPHEYLVKQLLDFKPKTEGAKPLRGASEEAPSAMAPMAAPLTPEDIRDIAFYLTRQSLNWETAASASNEDTMTRGQQIWRGGLPDRRVPACAGCHSPDGAGVPGAYPRLAGQFPEYLADQLKQFRSGARTNSAMMHDIADRMSDSDIAAVADYAAGLR